MEKLRRLTRINVPKKRKKSGEYKENLLAKRQGLMKEATHKTYDHRKIMAEMLEWARDDTSINFCGFCADRGYTPKLIWRLGLEHEEFEDCYTVVKMKLAERRERLANCDQLIPQAYAKYQRMYDAFLDKKEDEIADKEAARKKEIVNTESVNLFMLAQMAAEGKISQQ